MAATPSECPSICGAQRTLLDTLIMPPSGTFPMLLWSALTAQMQCKLNCQRGLATLPFNL